MKDLIDAVMKWLEASTQAAESQIKYNDEWSLSKETEVEMEDREDWANKFQDEWEGVSPTGSLGPVKRVDVGALNDVQYGARPNLMQ